LRPAFFLTGEGPRFLQEFDGIDGDEKPIEALLIDTPGENGQKKNADLLTHRRRCEMLGMPAAAMALYALQQFAPPGGAGNRTSLRAGGR
jgi:CRISPR system Cascade subunit CasA